MIFLVMKCPGAPFNFIFKIIKEKRKTLGEWSCEDKNNENLNWSKTNGKIERKKKKKGKIGISIPDETRGWLWNHDPSSTWWFRRLLEFWCHRWCWGFNPKVRSDYPKKHLLSLQITHTPLCCQHDPYQTSITQMINRSLTNHTMHTLI